MDGEMAGAGRIIARTVRGEVIAGLNRSSLILKRTSAELSTWARRVERPGAFRLARPARDILLGERGTITIGAARNSATLKTVIYDHTGGQTMRSFMGRDILSLKCFEREEFFRVFQVAQELAPLARDRRTSDLLKDKTLVTAFYQP